jgi:O-antigen/teichoic acid export membrane protein
VAGAPSLAGATCRARAVPGSRLQLTAPWQLVARVAKRLGWGVADQAVSSLTNFAASIYVFHALGPVVAGAFSIAYVTYSFALNASRGLATDPLMVRFSGTDDKTWRIAVAQCTGTSTVVGLACATLVLASTLVLHGATRDAMLALGLTLPGLMLQDSWRYAFFALGKGSRAFLNDVVWAVTLLPALLVLHASRNDNVFWFMLAWGGTASFGAAIGPLQSLVVPNVAGARHWLTRHRDLGLRYMAEGTASSVASQLRTYGVALLLTLGAVGYLSAATTLMGPMTILFLGMALVVIPEGARVLQRSPNRLPAFCALVSAGLCVAGLVWGVVLLVAVPRGLGQMVLGPHWRPTYPLILPSTISVLGLAVSIGASAGLHALGAAKRSLRAMIIGSAANVGFALAGAATSGLTGTVRGLALASWFAAGLTWWEYRGATRDSRVPAVGRPAPSPSAAYDAGAGVPTWRPTADLQDTGPGGSSRADSGRAEGRRWGAARPKGKAAGTIRLNGSAAPQESDDDDPGRASARHRRM